MKLSQFDYHLPEHLIATHPLVSRSASRLMVLHREDKTIQHCQFKDLPQFLHPHDLLVFNNSKVMPARLFGVKSTGGKGEILIERVIDDQTVLAHVKASKVLKPGNTVVLGDKTVLNMVTRVGDLFQLELEQGNIWEVMDHIGHMPLPHYMNREDVLEDRERYQTVYADPLGSVAAPTAGLHFDQALLNQLSQQGVEQTKVTLHVGAGTFQPVRSDNITEHHMHSEWIEVPGSVCKAVQIAKSKSARVIAVGTTSVRSLESAAKPGQLQPYHGETDIFIYPGYQFKVVDAMITNFHLPKSSLLMLVSAFAGLDFIQHAYQEAIRHEYRFYSYGDAMLIV